MNTKVVIKLRVQLLNNLKKFVMDNHFRKPLSKPFVTLTTECGSRVTGVLNTT